MTSNYERFPEIQITRDPAACQTDWHCVIRTIREKLPRSTGTICIECYPGTYEQEIEAALREHLPQAGIILSREALRSPQAVKGITAHDLPNDPVFGRLSALELADFFDPDKLRQISDELRSSSRMTVVLGTGTILIPTHYDLLVYADLARWEIQQRQRQGRIGNLGLENVSDKASEKYRRAFFVDWRAADRTKKKLLPAFDFYLDTNAPNAPKLLSGDLYRSALKQIVQRPFRLRPFFDPGPWGGQWMKEVCGLTGRSAQLRLVL